MITPEAPDAKRLRLLVLGMEQQIKDGQQTLDEFSASVLIDPHIALRYTHDAIRASARKCVAQHVLKFIEGEKGSPAETLTTIRNIGLRAVLREVEHAHPSSNPTADMVDHADSAAWARLINDWFKEPKP